MVLWHSNSCVAVHNVRLMATIDEMGILQGGKFVSIAEKVFSLVQHCTVLDAGTSCTWLSRRVGV